MRNPGVSAVLSFFIPGLGQIYNGQIGMGLLAFFLMTISAALCFVYIGIVTTPILWIIFMVTAYQDAVKLNKQSARPQTLNTNTSNSNDISNESSIRTGNDSVKNALFQFFKNHNLEKYEVDCSLQIVYKNSDGNKTKHTIDVKYFEKCHNELAIKAYCHLSNEFRIFLSYQIITAVDIKNSEIIDNIEIYLMDLFSKQTAQKELSS